MFKDIKNYLNKPALYAESTSSIWTDEYISKQMLEAHLNPDWDAATRNHSFVEKSVDWISKLVPPTEFGKLLDLGCGPGLYAERFHKAGYSVTGVDFSKNSIEYAKEQTKLNNSGIEYFCRDYLTLDYKEEFDIVTLIYCDYAVLSLADRITLMKKIHSALKCGGKLIFDVFKPTKRHAEEHTWEYCENGGFFSPKPYLCIDSVYQYEEDETELCQSLIVTDDGVSCYNVWDHFFTEEKLREELASAGFADLTFYGDVAGAKYSDETETICTVAVK